MKPTLALRHDEFGGRSQSSSNRRADRNARQDSADRRPVHRDRDPSTEARRAGLFALTGPASAAQTPCWKTLLNDWYKPPINGTYPISCYQQAIDHLPTDAQAYSDAADQIRRAMTQAIALQKQQSETTTQATTTAPAEATTTSEAETTPAAPATTATTPTTTEEQALPPPPATTTSPGRDKPKGVARALDKLNPGDADSFPLPLLILGALAILLVAAGVIGMIWRRMDRGGPDIDAGAGAGPGPV
jgi:hypothetical protein